MLIANAIAFKQWDLSVQDRHLFFYGIIGNSMETKYYLPDGDSDREVWLTNFQAGVALLPSTWNIGAPQQLSLLNDANAYRYSLVFLEAAKAFSKSSSASKDAFRNGPATVIPQAFPVFTPPVGAPLAVTPGIFIRVILLVGQIKKNALYTEAIGTALKIIGADIVIDLSTAHPVLDLSMGGGLVHIKYIRGHAEGIILYCMRGTETTFTLLATVTKTSYIDTRPNLVVGQSEKRQYRAFFMVGDVMVGIESAIFSINC
jgi:hypothetical protein